MNLFTLTSTTTKTLLLRTPSPFTRPSTILIKRLSSNTSFSSSSISIKPRMRIHFTCTANTSTHHQLQPPQLCGHQNIHEFTKLAYERGIVLVECPNCHNRHLIGIVLYLSSLILALRNKSEQLILYNVPLFLSISRSFTVVHQ